MCPQYIFFDKYLTRKGGGEGKYGKDDNLLSFFVHLFVYNLVHVDKVSLSDKIAPEKNNLQQNICRFWRRPPVHVFKTGTNQPNHHPPWITL